MIITAQQIQAFSAYLLEEEKSAATLEKYLRDVCAFRAFLKEKDVTKDAVISYKKYLVEQRYAVHSINSMLASVNSFLGFAGFPQYKVKSLRIQRQIYCPEEKELTRAEYTRLVSAAKGNERLSLVLQTICATGIRVSELQYFTVEAVKQGQVTVNCKSKTRNIFLPGKLKKLLLAYAQKIKKHKGVIFTGKSGKPLNRSYIWAAMKRLCKAANVSSGKVFPHNLRKLFARTFYAQDKDIAKLADILGHSSINTTRIYIMTTGMEHRQKIERMGLVVT